MPQAKSSFEVFRSEELSQDECKIAEIIHLIKICFPTDDAGIEIKNEEALSAFAGFYDLQICTWLLLWDLGTGGGARRLIGFCTLATFSSATYISNLCVHPSYQGRGLGRFLLEQAQIVVFQKHGCFELCGAVDSNRTELHSLYSHLGARPIENTAFGSAENTVSVSRHYRFQTTASEVSKLSSKWASRDPLDPRAKSAIVRRRVYVATGAAAVVVLISLVAGSKRVRVALHSFIKAPFEVTKKALRTAMGNFKL